MTLFMEMHNQKKTLDGAVKHDDGKPRWDLVALLPPKALIEMALVMEGGADKYGAWEWRKGMKWTRLVAATLRHTMAFACGEDRDPDTGLLHLAHAAVNCMLLAEYLIEGLGTDDRYKKP